MNDASSHWDRVKSGVLQGSVLGPLLFILISDLDDNVTCGIKLFVMVLKFILPFRTLLTRSFYVQKKLR